MARRRNLKPIFIDEPIQWHLSTSKHDLCTICGMQSLGYLGSKERTCLNSICGVHVWLEQTVKEWYQEKLCGEEGPGFGRVLHPSSFEIVRGDEAGVSRTRAWQESNAKIAVTRRVHPFLTDGLIYWVKGAPWPYFYLDGKEMQACEPGSPMWRRLASLSNKWQASRKRSPLELLAQQAPDPKNIREDMGFVVTA